LAIVLSATLHSSFLARLCASERLSVSAPTLSPWTTIPKITAGQVPRKTALKKASPQQDLVDGEYCSSGHLAHNNKNKSCRQCRKIELENAESRTPAFRSAKSEQSEGHNDRREGIRMIQRVFVMLIASQEKPGRSGALIWRPDV
jgi:hypothetical protein